MKTNGRSPGTPVAPLALGLVLSAWAVAAEPDLSEALSRCSALDDVEIRLRCFESLDRSQPIAIGQQEPPRGGVDTDRTIESRVDDLARRPRGEYVFRLANGQSWTELEAGSNHYRVGAAVVIKPTTAGAHMLTTTAGQATRVRLMD